MKVFVSQPMRSKTKAEILSERKQAKIFLQEKYPNEKIEIIDNFFEDKPAEANPLYFLAKSLELMSTADLAYFIGDWRIYRGCLIELNVALQYGIECAFEPKQEDGYR